MAFTRGILAILVALVVVPLAYAEFHLECQMLPIDDCTFAVSYDGHRCVLEKDLDTNSHVCQTSDIVVGEETPVEYIETESCVRACGADRMMVGFSTDELTSGSFTSKLCSPVCRSDCPNLIDLYSNIIAGEGLTISEFCGEQRRSMLMQSRRLIASSPL